MRKAIYILLLLLCAQSIQAKKYYFRHYENEDGLSHNTVTSCMQDKRGFMWFGTKDGLNRFDGMRFKVFRNQQPEKSIPNNVITSIKEDHAGLIWIGTFNGLCSFDYRTDRFNTLYIKGYAIKGVVNDINVDLKDNIWFITRTGVYRYDKTRRSLLFFPHNKDFRPTYIYVTKVGDVWFCSQNGKIYKYIEQIQNFQGFRILSEKEKKESVTLRRIREYNDHYLLISTDKNGLRLFDTYTGSVSALFTKNKNNEEMIINDFLVTRKKEIWVGADNGLYRYDFINGLSQPIRNIIDNPYSISDNGIRALWEDNEGGLWACTFYGGINYLPKETTPFEKFVPSSLPAHIQGEVIRAICGDKNGTIWIGSEDNGLCCYDPQTDVFTNFPLHENIQSLLICDNQLWIGSYINGIYILDLNSKKLSQPQFKNFDSKSIVTLLLTREHTIYAGTTSGLYRCDPTKRIMTKLNTSQLSCFIHCIHEDKNGLIWIGTYGNGLYSYNQKNNVYKHYTCSDNDAKTVSSNYITSIYEDSKKQLWFTTEDNGFCKLNNDGKTFTRFFTEAGFPSITCAISEDKKGNLWISSTRGLIRFNSRTNKNTIFKKQNGLVDNHFSYNSQYTDANGKMYYGTIKGMIAFKPEDMKENYYTPSIYITGFYTNGNSKTTSEKGKSIIETRKIVLPYNTSSFSVDFIAPSYTNPQLNKYRYILEGYDRNWNYITDLRRIYYTKVPPGSYILKVEVLGHNQKWDSHGTSIDIIVTPPFWDSAIAYIIFIFIIAGILLWIYKNYNAKKNREHQQIIHELEMQKEKELYNAKIQFFTNITHEVRTPLSLIKIPLDKLIASENLSDFIKDNLSIMKRNVDRLLDLINQLLDFRKTEMEMLRLNFVKTDINSIVKNTIDRFIPSAQESGKRLILHQPQQPNILAVDQEIITKILSNLLTNALKYSNDLIEVFIETPINDKMSTYIRINSNGCRIPENLQDKIFEPFYQIEQNPAIHTKKGTGLGLSLAKSLAELHHGKLIIDPKVLDMNSFVLSLSNIQEENVKVKHSDTNVEDEYTHINNKINDSRWTILIVDDEKSMTQFIANELSPKYNTWIAYDGRQAIEVLKKEQIHLVVSDVLMPVMDGYALCNYIKSSSDYCHIPVILLTASVALNSRITGLESGADGYIEKPFTMELLIGQIDNIFRNKELACNNFIKSPLSNYRSIAVNRMDEDFMKRLHSIILSNMSDSDFKVEKLASMMNMSISTLFRKVKAITDLSPNEYIRLYRLKKAAEMLVEGHYKINEIAYIVGFSTQSYFATSFQKQFNMSPTDFIKQQKKEDK